MKYTVTIKDNESGEILRELECNAIIGGVSLKNDESASLVLASCNGKELSSAYLATKKAIEVTTEKNPLLAFVDLLAKLEKKEDTDND